MIAFLTPEALMPMQVSIYLSIYIFTLFLLYYSYDFSSSFEKVMGKHDDVVRCVEYCPEVG